MTNYKTNFLNNLEVLDMKESDLGRKFKHLDGKWCTFLGVDTRKPSKPMVFEMGGKTYITTISDIKFYLS